MLMRIIDEMKRSIDNECFIAALMLALSIPDICGKAEYPRRVRIDKRLQRRRFFRHDLQVAEPVLLAFPDPLAAALLDAPQTDDILQERSLPSVPAFICNIVIF